jgi:hypothetical protein
VLKICLHGHEWAKRQLQHQHQGIAFEALDNGFWKCADPQRPQQTCDELGPSHLQQFLQRWLQRLPFPLDPKDQQAAYAPRLSIWQMEFSLTDYRPAPPSNPPWNVDVPHPLRDKLQELDLVLNAMLHHAHLQNEPRLIHDHLSQNVTLSFR